MVKFLVTTILCFHVLYAIGQNSNYNSPLEVGKRVIADLLARGIEAECRHEFEGMLTRCRAMHEVFNLVRRIAPTDSTVLVSGESGTPRFVGYVAVSVFTPPRK